MSMHPFGLSVVAEGHKEKNHEVSSWFPAVL